jgi:hypothetical protein
MHGNPAAQKPDLARPAMTAESATTLLQTVASLNGQIVQTARQAMEMERLHLGEPTNLIGLQAKSHDMTLDEAEALFIAGAEAWEAWKRNNGAMTLDPGIDEPELGEVVEDI